MYFGVLNNGYFILIVNVNFFKSGFKKGKISLVFKFIQFNEIFVISYTLMFNLYEI